MDSQTIWAFQLQKKNIKEKIHSGIQETKLKRGAKLLFFIAI